MNPSGSYDFIRALVYQQLQVPVYTESTYENSNIAFPLMVMSRNGTNSLQTMNGPSTFYEFLTFNIKGKTIEKVEEIRDFLIALLDGYSDQLVLRSESNTFDVDNDIYTRAITFGVVYNP
jgi:hypothetical protein